MAGDWDVRVDPGTEPLVWAPAMSRRDRRAARKREQRHHRLRQGAFALGALLVVSGGVLATNTLIRSSAGPEPDTSATVAGTSVTRSSSNVDIDVGTGASPISTDRSTEEVPSSLVSPTSLVPPTGPLAPVAAVPAEARSVRLMFSGDMIPHTPLVARAAANGKANGERYAFDPMLASIRPIISSADIAICHLESPISPDDVKVTGFPTFNAPVELAHAIAVAGYDGCSVASNHALDAGRTGVGRTLDALDASGLKHAGTARSAQERETATTYVANGVKVAHLSYAYGINGQKVPADQPWLVNIIDPNKIIADAHAAKVAGADIVVVSLHCCVEYQHTPAPLQKQLADTLLASDDIDLIVGHHAHVIQPIAKVHGKVVSYGLGNLLTNQSSLCCVPETQDGMILDVSFSGTPGSGRFAVDELRAHPTWVDRDGGYIVTPVVAALADPATPAPRRALLEASLVRTTQQLQAMGVPVDTTG